MLSDPKASENVICLHPAVEERGRVKSDDSSVFTVSLKDCLACSGCAITEDEITLLARQDPSKILERIAENPGFLAVVSTAAIANVAAARHWPLENAFASIAQFFRARGAADVVSDGLWQSAYRRLVVEQVRSGALPRPVILSRCPGAVLFFERRTKYASHLAHVKPFAQLFSLFAKNKLGAKFVVSVAPCFDRKLETGRFEGEVDAVMTVGEIAPHLEEAQEGVDGLRFPKYNDVHAIICELAGVEKAEESMNGKIVEYKAGELTGALVCGEAMLRRLCANIDRGKCAYDVVQADFCPVSCMSGGGLIRGSNPRERRQLVESTKSTHESIETEENRDDLTEVVEFLKTQKYDVEYVSEEKDEENDLTF